MVTSIGSAAGQRFGVLLGLAVCACLVVSPAFAQPPAAAAGRGGQQAQAGRADVANIQELQRLFDAYVVIRAQEALKLDDEKFTVFLPKLRALQEARRRGEVAHNQMVADLNRLTGANAQFDEAKARDTIKALQDLDIKTAAEVRKAYDAVDQLLDVRQQARFRIFEVQMERRKIDLLLQARKADAAKPKADEPGPIRKPPTS